MNDLMTSAPYPSNRRLVVPQSGGNMPYIVTFALFTILALPTALVDNLGGLLFPRFLLGLFGSPCLANGGASLGVCLIISTLRSDNP